MGNSLIKLKLLTKLLISTSSKCFLRHGFSDSSVFPWLHEFLSIGKHKHLKDLLQFNLDVLSCANNNLSGEATFWGRWKSHIEWGQVNRVVGNHYRIFGNQKTEQLMLCLQACCSSTFLDVYTWCSHIATSKLHRIISQGCYPVGEDKFLLGNSLDIKKNKNNQHEIHVAINLTCLVAIYLATVNLVTSTATTAALSQSHNHKPMTHQVMKLEMKLGSCLAATFNSVHIAMHVLFSCCSSMLFSCCTNFAPMCLVSKISDKMHCMDIILMIT